MIIYTLENEFQKLEILNYGATIYRWFAFSEKENIVLSNKNLKDYLNPKNGHLGGTIGRVTNRTNKGIFYLDNQKYQLELNFDGNHGHGGSYGFFRQKFDLVKKTNTKLILKYIDPNLKYGYPGNLDTTVTYELKDNEMILTFEATTDQKTIVNITNHAYFNLSNESNILSHFIKANSENTLDTDLEFIPTGKIINNTNNILNLNNEKLLNDIVLNSEILKKAKGLDHFFLFDSKENFLDLTYQNKTLRVETSYPGMQLYSLNYNIEQKLENRTFNPYLGLAIEPSFEPDAINHENFSNIILKPNETYKHYIKYSLIEKKDAN